MQNGEKMFKKIFIELCEKKKEAPTAVCLKLGLSNAAYSQWTDKTIPRRSTLDKIADYFNVTVDYLLGKEHTTNNKNTSTITLNNKEIMLIKKYRLAAKSVQDGIDTILEINSEAGIVDDIVETIRQNSDVPTKAN